MIKALGTSSLIVLCAGCAASGTWPELDEENAAVALVAGHFGGVRRLRRALT